MAWMYHADLYCDECGRALKEQADAQGDEDTGDTGGYPQDVSNLDDTADSPTHCAGCGIFMENSLTDEGLDYVLGAVVEALAAEQTDAVALRQWAPFYDIPTWDPAEYGASRFDIIEGAWHACNEYHAGQWSRGYRHLCKLSRHFRPGPDATSRKLKHDALAAYIQVAVSLTRHP